MASHSVDMSLSKLRELVRTGRPGVLQSTGSESDTNEKVNNSSKNQSHPGVPFVGIYGYIPITHIFLPYHFSEGHICKGPS